ncbi:major facilitator superfamily domain-containing protein, partial [Cercophora newfieldiana]
GFRPWKVVVGCFCLTIAVYGLLSSIGLFHTYWHKHQLAEKTETEISWVISVFGFLGCFCGVLAGLLFDRFGARLLLPLTSIAYVVSFIGLAFSTTYGQFMGCFILAGIASAPPTTIAFSVVSQWFNEMEGIATGCVTLGAAVGGIVFSLLLQKLFDSFPWQTAMLALSAVLSGLMLLGNLLTETNLITESSPGEEGSEWYHSVLLGLLRSSKFWLVTYAIFGEFASPFPPSSSYELVLFIQWGSIPTYAVMVGMGENQFYLMMSYNIGAIIGRTAPLWLSDRKMGPINTIILMNVFTLLAVLVVWLPFGALTLPALFAVVVTMGIGTGSFVPLGVACVSELSQPGTTGTFLGSVYTVVSIATLIGNPSTGAILNRYGSHGLVAFIAIVLFSGLASAVALRWECHGRRWIMMDKI